jgi:hypothetical protein
MHLFIDLKICEGCGSLWYRATGGAKVYCKSCEAKLGEFPSPRTRRRPGGRRKIQAKAFGLVQTVTGGER